MILHCQHALLFYLPTPVVASCVAIPASTKHRDNAGRRNSPVDSWWLGCAGTRFMRRLPIGLANALSQPSALVELVTISRLSSWSFSQYRDQRKSHDSGPSENHPSVETAGRCCPGSQHPPETRKWKTTPTAAHATTVARSLHG